MISIFASTEWEEKVKNVIATEERLHELININAFDAAQLCTVTADIIVDDNGISVSPDWYNLMPPVLFPPVINFDTAVLLGLVFCRLANFEKSYFYLAGFPGILKPVDIINRLINNVEMDEVIFDNEAVDFTNLHNSAISYQYGTWRREIALPAIESVFYKALESAGTAERHAFTARHFATFLCDAGDLSQAELVLEKYLATNISPIACIGLKSVLCNVWLKQLTVPYDQSLLSKLKDILWECLQSYEADNRNAEAALLLIDASHVANISNSFTESLGYINKAIGMLQKESLTELWGSAQLRKGMLLYTWAQNGQPQFYRTALQALQEALKIFDRAVAPDVFADIHHHLGIIYAEIQDEVKKKAVWAAVSVSSFTEALNFYNKVDYPYEFAMICHHFGNAYTKYPAAVHSDNFDKALAWYREALDIRTAAHYPIERCNTLYNYLEASWEAGNPTEGFNEERYNEMWSIAHELSLLTTDENLKSEAYGHIEALKKLKENFNPAETTVPVTIHGIQN